MTVPRYFWPQDLKVKGAVWVDYTDPDSGGRWESSALWSTDGNLLAELQARHQGKRSRNPKSVIWSSVFGHAGREATRQEAKRKARAACRFFLAKSS